MSNKVIAAYPIIISAIVLAACQPPPATPEPAVETMIVTQEVEATPVEVIQVITPTPEPGGPPTLVICQANEPETLYLYGSQEVSKDQIFEAIADGGWSAFDNNSFAYQPVILEKLPNLADGDAVISVVIVGEGDRVVDADGALVTLDPAADPPIMLIPAGGGGPVPYQGGIFEMQQLSATFKLLPGLLWSDGEPLTAADSVYAFHLMADPGTVRNKDKVERTASYEALDERTTVWTGLPGFMDASYNTNFFGPAPEHLWEKYSVVELIEAEESSRKPVGWGPYVIDEWVQGESITLHKNPNYFRGAEGLPKFDTLIFRFVGDNTSAHLAALLSGECDILSRKALHGDLDRQLLDLHQAGQINATFTSGTIWEHLDFGIQHVDYDDGYQQTLDRPDFFSDVRTRRAFILCMDRQAVSDARTLGQGNAIDSYVPTQHPLYNPDVHHYDFDPAAGSALLEEIGWVDDDGNAATPRIAQGVQNVPDGTRLVVTYQTGEPRSQTANILQGFLAQCGIQANIEILSGSELFAVGPEGSLFGRHFDLGQFSWLTSVEPPCDLYLSTNIPGPVGEDWVSIQDGVERTFGISDWGGQNNPGFANEDYDAACRRALNSLPDQINYAAAHREAQRILAEQLPVVSLYHQIKLAATRPDMCGFIMDPSNNTEFWNIEELDYGEECE